MRKLDAKLSLTVGLAKREAGIIAGRSFRVAHRANGRVCCFEELWSMTIDAGTVIRIVSGVRKASNLLPILSWSFVALITG
jgi:hypothetical protein